MEVDVMPENKSLLFRRVLLKKRQHYTISQKNAEKYPIPGIALNQKQV